MSGKDRDHGKELARLTDALIENLMATPDEAIIAEVAEENGDAVAEAERMGAILTAVSKRAAKRKLEAARAALRQPRASTAHHAPSRALDVKKRLLMEVIARQKSAPQRLTLAARNADDLTEADIDSLLEDFQDLGLINPTDKP